MYLYRFGLAQRMQLAHMLYIHTTMMDLRVQRHALVSHFVSYTATTHYCHTDHAH